MVDDQISLLDASLREGFDRSIRGEVETMISMLARVDTLRAEGVLTTEKAEEVARKLLRDIRYNETDYFWADTQQGVNVVLLGRKEVEGTNRLDSADVKGFKLIRSFIEKANQGGGFTDYWFPKASGGDAFPKRGYSLLSKPWGWVVGTGVYIDKVSATVTEKRQAALDPTLRRSGDDSSVRLVRDDRGRGGVDFGRDQDRAAADPRRPNAAPRFPPVTCRSPLTNATPNRRTKPAVWSVRWKRCAATWPSWWAGWLRRPCVLDSGARELKSTAELVSSGASAQAASTEEVSASTEQMVATIRQNAENANETERIARKAAPGRAGRKRRGDRGGRGGEAHRRTHRRDRGDRAADQSAGAQRRDRGGPRGRGRQRLLCRRRRNTQAGRAVGHLGFRDPRHIAGDDRPRPSGPAPSWRIWRADITKTADLISEISAATAEQRAGADQIGQAMTQLDSVVQRNAASSEELAAAAQTLNDEAERLRDAVGSFKV